MGISAVALPGAELIPSAQKGIIDGGEWLMPGEDIKLGLHQVWKHYYLQGFHQASDFGSLILNKDFWNSLTPDLQAIIRISAQASIVDSITISIHQNGVALEELKSKHGVQIHRDSTGSLSGVRQGIEAVGGEIFGAECVLQEGSGVAAGLCQDHRSVLDRSSWPVPLSGQSQSVVAP